MGLILASHVKAAVSIDDPVVIGDQQRSDRA